jgi:hypothetical protein
MEVYTRPGMGRDSACHVSEPVNSKSKSAALGFQVKSGWAVAALVAGPVRSPRLCDSRMIELSDARFPETRQPYHAAMGKLETDPVKIRARLRVVRRIARQSIAKLLAEYRGFVIRRAALVVGSQIDPALIANPHIRAHALEGQLFRTALDDALRAHRIHTVILIERDAYSKASAHLKKANSDVRCVTQNLGRSGEGPWRAEQKLAALAAWFALSR